MRLRDAVITLAGSAAVAAGVCAAWPAPGCPEPLPGEAIAVKASRVDVVDERGNTKLTLVVQGGSLHAHSGGRNINVSRLIEQFAPFMDD